MEGFVVQPAVGDVLKIKDMASPGESIGAEVSFEMEVPVCGGRYEYLLEDIKVPDGSNNRFTVTADGVQNLHSAVFFRKSVFSNSVFKTS